MIIGICGKSGSGKSTLANEILKFKRKGIHIDIDKVGHYILTLPEVKQDLIDSFGTSILNGDDIDRKKLGSIVFSSKLMMDILSKITWKYMQLLIDKLIKENENNLIILDWILLPQTKYFHMCDITILLDVSFEERLQRAMLRDKITAEEFVLRDNASITYNNESFDYVFSNYDIDVKRILEVVLK